ncbi:MAG: tRNA lysidine(34) synthetase TilS [Firmicutes bacterium]|nr:tRNA lysidine(34) synthetase TilS [Bacillota bacterium]
MPLMNNKHALYYQTRKWILAHKLIQPGFSVVAAVSAGRDSCVMLHVLIDLSKELNYSLVVAHFDHQLRKESLAEQQFVQKLALDYGLPFYAGCADPNSIKKGGNVEDAARHARYAFLRKIARQSGAAKIAVAHHAQDQAETVLMHLLRGCGLEGLSAMAADENNIIRPLLSAMPQQLESYCRAYDVAFCVDESNMDTRYLRNHLRLDILPQLLQINPHLLQALTGTADICREENSLLTEYTQAAVAKFWQKDRRFLDKGFFALAPALQRRVVRQVFYQVSSEELSFTQTEAALALKEEQSLSCPKGWLIYRRGALYVGREQPALPQFEEIIKLRVDGAWHDLAGWGWEYLADDLTACSGPENKEEYHIVVPGETIGRLYFRTRREGDAVITFTQEKRRKVKEIFIAAKIPPYLRVGWPLLFAAQEMIWLPGLYKRHYEKKEAALMVKARRKKESLLKN